MWQSFTLFLALLSGINSDPKLKPEESHQSLSRSAIYLTIGEEAHDHKLEWSGCHITMAGFHPDHCEIKFLQKVPQILVENSLILKGWRPKKMKVEKWGKNWAITFKSETLNKITHELNRHGFKKIKGPIYANVPFHLVLPQIETEQDAMVYLEMLKNKTWYLTIVKEEPLSKYFNWSKYYVL